MLGDLEVDKIDIGWVVTSFDGFIILGLIFMIVA